MAAATMVASAIVGQVLNQDNYEDWSVQVKTYLMAEDLWDVVEATSEAPKREHGEAIFVAWRKKNAKALHAIQISCGPETFSLIRDKTTAKIAWDTLAAKFRPGLLNNQGKSTSFHTSTIEEKQAVEGSKVQAEEDSEIGTEEDFETEEQHTAGYQNTSVHYFSGD